MDEAASQDAETLHPRPERSIWPNTCWPRARSTRRRKPRRRRGQPRQPHSRQAGSSYLKEGSKAAPAAGRLGQRPAGDAGRSRAGLSGPLSETARCLDRAHGEVARRRSASARSHGHAASAQAHLRCRHRTSSSTRCTSSAGPFELNETRARPGPVAGSEGKGRTPSRRS